ncbi:MAG: hypothetical protein ACK58Q_09980 [Chitinophagales bacterium]|jgi:hypothetical protein
MSTLCEPICRISMCDSSVKIAESNEDLTLLISQSNKQFCPIELTSIAGDIVLTNPEIIDFGAEGPTFKIQLRDSNNTPVELMYKDCDGLDAVAFTIRLRFLDCEYQNDFLYEICNP